MTFEKLETARNEYRNKMTVKDGFTPEQQIAMTLLHNVDVTGGCHMSIAAIIPKPTLRALIKKGAIDEKSRLTKLGNDTLRSWLKDSKRKHKLRVLFMTSPHFADFDGMTWPMPSERLKDIAHKFRYEHESVTGGDLLLAAFVLDSYRELVSASQKKRERVVAGIRRLKRG